MGPIQVVVEDGNNLVLEVTPTPSTTVIIDRGIAGPPGPMGDGDVDGPASSTDNAIARFDGTTGKLIQNSNVTIDDGGNLGVGVTPSTWSSQIRAMQVYGGTSYWAYNFAGIQIGGVYFNAYNDGVAKYSNTNRAASFEWGTNDGAFKWLQAASGTANNAISFTQAMTLSANGNRQLGGTNSRTISGFTFDSIIGSSGAFTDYYSGVNRIGSVGCESTFFNIATGGSFPITFDTNGIERMRIDASGNVGIGTSSPSAKLDVTGTAAISGAVTLSGGTANGVAYLNGSKVLTTGSALTFDGTALTNTRNTTDGSAAALTLNNSGTTGSYATLNQNAGPVTYQQFVDAAGNAGVAGMTFRTTSNHPLVWGINSAEQMRLTSTGLGIGTSSPSGSGKILQINDASIAEMRLTTTASGITSGDGLTFQLNGLNGYIWNYESGFVSFGTSGAERMRLDSSGNLGIGTSSPTNPLTVRSAGTSTAYAGNIVARFESNGAGYSSTIQLSNNVDASATVGLVGSSLGFGVGTTQMLTLSSSGNLGLGVTPSAWSARALQVNARAALFAFSNDAHLGYNTYYGDTYRYIASDFATDYMQTSGQHRWFTAPSGTAGNAISFTQAMTLDASGNLGLGTASPSGAAGITFAINGGAGQTRLALKNNNSGDASSDGFQIALLSDGVNVVYQNRESGYQSWELAGSEGMRLTSTGLGINTTVTTNGRLTVNAGTAATGNSLFLTNLDGTINPYLQVQHSSAGVRFVVGNSFSGANNNLIFGSTNTLNGMTLNDSGNLGLGVTPSAWGGSGVRAFDVGSGASFAGSGGDAGMIANAYYNGTNWIYKTSSLAVRYQQLIGTGAHAWFTSPSGTAGNAISFTQAMTLDASGNLLLGETSRAYLSRFTLSYDPASTNGPIFLDSRSFAANRGAYLWLGGKFNTAGAYRPFGGIGAFKENGTDGDSTGYLAFATNGNSTDATERARIDSSGNLGLGVTPSAWGSIFRVQQFGNYGAFVAGRSDAQNQIQMGVNAFFNGTNFVYSNSDVASRYYQISGQHRWDVAPSGTAGNAISFSQAMTLDASGKLLLGTTSLVANEQFTMFGAYAAFANASYTAYLGAAASILNSGSASDFAIRSNNNLVFSAGGANESARIDSSGNLLVGVTSAAAQGGLTIYPTGSSGGPLLVWNRATTTNSTTAADFRNASVSSGSITYTNTATTYATSSDYRLKNTIAPMTNALAKVAALKPVTYKWNADGSDGEGFIAHELAEVVPQCVTGEKDAVDAEGNPVYQGIDTSFLVATLTAALQEAVAEINSLKARLDAANI